MTIHLDTSALIGALAAPHSAGPALRRLLAQGHVPALSSPVLFEWLRGPRTPEELRDQQALAPDARAVSFGADTARIAAHLYAQLTRRQDRAIDIAIAACAIEHHAALWTLNPEDFADIPGLRLYQP